MSSIYPGVGPRCSQSEGLKGPIEELVVNTLELVFGGTGGGPLPVLVNGPKSVETASVG